MKLMYCCGSGLFSPSRSRRSATSCGDAVSPSIVCTGSPGMRWISENTSVATPTRTGIVRRRRRMRNATMSGSLTELLMGPIDLLGFPPEMLLHFRAQVGHLIWIVLQPGFLISRKDVFLAGISRHSEDGVRIELLFRS